MLFRLLVPGKGFPSMGSDPSSSSERASSPSEQSHHESLIPTAHDDCQAPTSAGLSSQTSTLLFSPLTEDSHAPIEPFGAASQLVPAASQEPDTSSQPMAAASQELPSASVPVGASSNHSGAASQPDTAASQLPNATIEPLASSHQQSHQPLGAASPLTDSASPNPRANVTVAPAQSSDHRLQQLAASWHAGSRQGVVMLLCILSLMPRSPSFYPRSLL